MKFPAPHALRDLPARSTRPVRLAACICAALLLGACASKGPDHPPLARRAPATVGLTAPTTTPVAEQWWSAFGDARLNELVERALQDQPSLATARARVARARALAANAFRPLCL